MTQPNSGFIAFNYKDKIVAQAWVWYDETNKVICLDNIEVPRQYLEKINNSQEIKESFIKCLLRISENFKQEMRLHNLEVTKVTIGKGYNDVQNILEDKFEDEKTPQKLHGYIGYSDAYSQYEIKSLSIHKSR